MFVLGSSPALSGGEGSFIITQNEFLSIRQFQIARSGATIQLLPIA